VTNPVKQAAEYLAQLGHPPPLDTSELAWQWDYRGTKEERQRLQLELGLEPESDEPATQDEKLF
jgi:hypothetical protein